MEKQILDGLDRLLVGAIDYSTNIAIAIFILIAGWILSRWLKTAAHRGLGKLSDGDVTLQIFASGLVRYAVLILTAILALGQLGVETASLITVIGAAGLAIGLALQGTLSNVAAGILLLFLRPFKVGQYVQAAGQSGTVIAVRLFNTELATPDNVQIIVPNAAILSAEVLNYSYHHTRRMDLIVGIGYGASIDQAKAVCESLLAAEGRILDVPKAEVLVSALADSSVNLTLRFWCKSADYWPLKFDLTGAVKEQLEAAGIEIPFPQRSVHIISSVNQSAA